jgi:hypothetical protein
VSRRLWTPEEDARLKLLVAGGATSREAALALGRTRPAVDKRRALLGLHTPPEHLAANIQRGADLRRGRPHSHPGYRKTPASRAKAAASMRAFWARADEATRERIAGKIRQQCADEERQRARGRKSGEARLPWCPPSFRQEYRRLQKNKGMTAAEARAALLPEITRWLRTFEGQLWKVKTGRARVVPTVHLSRPIATPFSLTGGSL